MSNMVQCPNCNGRGTIGYGIKDQEGMVAFYDFECPYCRGRCWVSKARAEHYEKEKENKKAEEKTEVVS